MVWLVAFFVVLAAAGAGLYLLLRRVGSGGSLSWYAFWRLCRSRDLDLSEARLLERLVRAVGVVNPIPLFSSAKLLDRAFHAYVLRVRRSDLPEDRRELVVARVMGIRRKFEFDQARRERGIENTFAIRHGQALRLSVPGVGYFLSSVIDRNSSYIICAFPQGAGAERMRWKGKKVGVYFWRENDAGYWFQSEVLGELHEKDLHVVFVDHARKLQRNQQRRNLRVDCRLAARVTPIVIEQSGAKRVARAGAHGSWRGVITNISGDGMALELERDPAGTQFYRVDFNLEDGGRVWLIAKARGEVVRRRDSGHFRLSLQFVRIDLKQRNDVLLFVYKYHVKPV